MYENHTTSRGSKDRLMSHVFWIQIQYKMHLQVSLNDDSVTPSFNDITEDAAAWSYFTSLSHMDTQIYMSCRKLTQACIDYKEVDL